MPKFQSAPPVETRGDSLSHRAFLNWMRVSIRSPRRNEGRLVRVERHSQISFKFQSAPPVETRGDRLEVKARDAMYEFQSAPPVETRGDWVPS